MDFLFQFDLLNIGWVINIFIFQYLDFNICGKLKMWVWQDNLLKNGIIGGTHSNINDVITLTKIIKKNSHGILESIKQSIRNGGVEGLKNRSNFLLRGRTGEDWGVCGYDVFLDGW